MNYDPPRAAYLHVPFCAHRCGYCDFTVIAGRDDLADDYLQAMAIELSWLGEPREVDTLYFGGGTPTQLPPLKLASLLAMVNRQFPTREGSEVTVEANPADLSSETIGVLIAGGVNRLSLGAQSFATDKLAVLERDHDGPRIAEVVATARAAGLTNISLDLIFAAPGETMAGWQDDLATALALDVPHVSTYGLTFEPGTAFDVRRMKGTLYPVDEELEREMYIAAIDTLTAGGMEHYEVSNFAKPGHRSRHNETYWRGDGYYAAGPGATRYVNGQRETNHRSTTTWLKKVLAGESALVEREALSPQDRARERLVFGLRRLEGVCLTTFAEATGYTVDDLAAATIAKFVDAELLARDDNTLRLTRKGLLISDHLWPDLI